MVVAGLETDVVRLVLIDNLEEIVDLEEVILNVTGLLEAFEIDIVLEVGAIDTEIFVFEPDEDALARETDGTDTFELWRSEEDAAASDLLELSVALV